MSWNISIVKLSAHKNTLSEMEAYLLPLDTDLGLINRLSEIFPQIKFETLTAWGTWGYLNGHDYTVQFELGCQSPLACKAITLHIRGWNSEGVLNQIIKPLCENTGWMAFDLSDGKRIDFSAPHPLAGFERWRQKRAQRLSTLMPDKLRVIPVGMF
ncbi:MAG: hypothetical protein U0694_05345 [Anaerolineae bacterium]